MPVLKFFEGPDFFSIPNMHACKTFKFHATENMGSGLPLSVFKVTLFILFFGVGSFLRSQDF